tara:strand:+ start:951 stop:1142 length:192 start_codon:yes stop_codon:yes gene_type:complete
MPRYSVKADGLKVIFKAKSQREAICKAYLISPLYSDLKRLESRWWLLVYPVLFLLGWYGVSLL